MIHEPQWHFITAGFGTMNYRARSRKLAKEISALNFFTSSTFYTEKNFREFLPAFHVKYRKMLKPWIHGFGYYIWKPALIQESLKQLPEHSYLVYLDAGYLIDATTDFKQAFAAIKDHTVKHGVTVFTSSLYLEHEFCSQDLFEYLSVPMEDRKSYQHLGGAIFIQNNEKGRDLVDKWVELTQVEDCKFLVPSSFDVLNHPKFVHHAHDQAVLSCLIKTRSTKSIIFFESSVPKEIDFTKANVSTTLPFIPARYRYGFPVASKSPFRRCFWKSIAVISRMRLAIYRRLFRKSVDNLLDN